MNIFSITFFDDERGLIFFLSLAFLFAGAILLRGVIIIKKTPVQNTTCRKCKAIIPVNRTYCDSKACRPQKGEYDY